MAKSVTNVVSVNGWLNLYTQAKADGYTGSSVVKEGTVLNLNATVAYLHLTEDGSTNPATAADGLPIGTTAATAPSSSFVLPEGTDLAGAWINTSGAQDIKYSFTGV